MIRVQDVFSLDEFLGRQVDTVRDFVSGAEDLNKEQLQNVLSIICNMVIGGGNHLPKVEDEEVSLVESVSQLEPLVFRVHTDNGAPMTLTLRGHNLRARVIQVLDLLQGHLLQHRADDHKTLSLLISAYECALHSYCCCE